MKKNADGSLTLYIQKDSPGKDKESNWLPAPNGPIYLVMRLYWPKDRAAVDPAAGRRHLAAAGRGSGRLRHTAPTEAHGLPEPKVVYRATAYAKGGKPEASVVDIEGTDHACGGRSSASA